MEKDINRKKIGVHPPKIHPKVTSVGYGNPRYNSMVLYKEGVLICSGTHFRYVNIAENKVILDQQIGCSMIFEIQENNKHILVVNYQGLVTLLEKDKL